MSRHKNMKYIAGEDFEVEDEEYYEDDYYYNEIDPEELSSYTITLDSLVDQVYDILGEGFSYDEICAVLKENNYDLDRAIDGLLNPQDTNVVAKPKKNKKKKKNKKGKNKDTEEPIVEEKEDPVDFPEQTLTKFDSVQSNLGSQISDIDSVRHRKRSINIENVMRKMSNNEVQVSRKLSKKYSELFDDTQYGNHDYPEISYKFNHALLAQKKNCATIVISGHVDSGKSTLLGQIMVLMNQVDKTVLRKLKQLEETAGKMKGRSLAWIFDERDDEREKGITVDVNEKYLPLGDKLLTFLDTPGHKDLVPKMISGASQCQFAMLIIDGVRDSFESGFDQKGQTREHAFLLNSIAPQKLFVIINKMDMNNWNEDEFKYIKSQIELFFERECLTNFGCVEFIPVSALKADNVLKPVGKKASWYKGPTLLDALKSLETDADVLASKPFRMNIQAYYESKEHGKKGYILSGRVEGGVVKKGDKLIVKPIDMPLTIKEVYIGDKKDDAALPGDIIDLIITPKNQKQWVDVRSGLTLSSIKYAVPVAGHFEAIVFLYELDSPILKGTRCDFHFGPLVESGVLEKLNMQKDPFTMEDLKKNPRFLLSRMCAIVEVKLDREMCLELERNFSGLGRFQFRDRGRTLGYGRILKLG